jgi:hypothetical protein
MKKIRMILGTLILIFGLFAVIPTQALAANDVATASASQSIPIWAVALIITVVVAGFTESHHAADIEEPMYKDVTRH